VGGNAAEEAFGEVADWLDTEALVDAAGGEYDEVLEVVEPADFKGGEHFLPGLLENSCLSLDLGLLSPLTDSFGDMLLFLLLLEAAALC